MDFRSAALLMINGGSSVTGTAKELEIWDNGDYEPTDDEKAEGIIAYDPLHVIVMPGRTRTFSFTENGTYSLTPDGDIYRDGALYSREGGSNNLGWHYGNINVPVDATITALSVSEPGTYYAKDYSCDGFDPVVVSSIYKDLYEYVVNGGGTNTTDDGKPVDNSIDTGNTDQTNDYLNISEGDFDTVTNSGNSVEIKFWVEKTPHPTQAQYWIMSYKYTVTNLNTGESTTGSCYPTNYGWNEATTKEPLFKIDSITYGSGICEIHYSMTRYNEDGTVRDTASNYRKVDHGSVNANTYTDHWIVSNSAT